jgi:polyisoprenoid-binding protein YceI
MFLGAMLLGTVAGCSDPADKVTKSSGSAPQAQPAPATATAGRSYNIQPPSRINFVGSKVTGSHNGGFTNVSGTFTVNAGKIVGAPEIQIDMKSTWADNPRLTGHLRSPDFFDIEKFPLSTFAITALEPAATNASVTGNLTLHGVTKSISFPALVQVADDAVTVKAQFAINRKDFNITYPGKPDDLIRDNVVIKLDVRAAP